MAGADRSRETAVLAYVHPNEIAHSWHLSVMELVGWDVAHHRRLTGGWLAMRCGSGGLVEARNKVAGEFLDREGDWLFVVDTDMGFAPDTLDRLLEAADPVERPMVGALCFAQREVVPDGCGGFRCVPMPTLFSWRNLGKQASGFSPIVEWPRDELVPVDGTGMACVVIHRRVFQAIKAKYGPTWHNRITNTGTGTLLGEDLSFCARAIQCDIPIHVHTGVKTTHLKQLWLGEDDYIRWQQGLTAATAAGGPDA